MESCCTLRLVKSEDLNHHGTLFAGRGAEWFVESGFIAAAGRLDPRRILCVKIHGMHFRRPVPPGSTIRYESRLVLAGRTSLVCHVRVTMPDGGIVVDGFTSFVHVGPDSRPLPHGLVVTAETDEERALQQEAACLVRRVTP